MPKYFFVDQNKVRANTKKERGAKLENILLSEADANDILEESIPSHLTPYVLVKGPSKTKKGNRNEVRMEHDEARAILDGMGDITSVTALNEALDDCNFQPVRPSQIMRVLVFNGMVNGEVKRVPEEKAASITSKNIPYNMRFTSERLINQVQGNARKKEAEKIRIEKLNVRKGYTDKEYTEFKEGEMPADFDGIKLSYKEYRTKRGTLRRKEAVEAGRVNDPDELVTAVYKNNGWYLANLEDEDTVVITRAELFKRQRAREKLVLKKTGEALSREEEKKIRTSGNLPGQFEVVSVGTIHQRRTMTTAERLKPLHRDVYYDNTSFAKYYEIKAIDPKNPPDGINPDNLYMAPYNDFLRQKEDFLKTGNVWVTVSGVANKSTTYHLIGDVEYSAPGKPILPSGYTQSDVDSEKIKIIKHSLYLINKYSHEKVLVYKDQNQHLKRVKDFKNIPADAFEIVYKDLQIAWRKEKLVVLADDKILEDADPLNPPPGTSVNQRRSALKTIKRRKERTEALNKSKNAEPSGDVAMEDANVNNNTEEKNAAASGAGTSSAAASAASNGALPTVSIRSRIPRKREAVTNEALLRTENVAAVPDAHFIPNADGTKRRRARIIKMEERPGEVKGDVPMTDATAVPAESKKEIEREARAYGKLVAIKSKELQLKDHFNFTTHRQKYGALFESIYYPAFEKSFHDYTAFIKNEISRIAVFYAKIDSEQALKRETPEILNDELIANRFPRKNRKDDYDYDHLRFAHSADFVAEYKRRYHEFMTSAAIHYATADGMRTAYYNNRLPEIAADAKRYFGPYSDDYLKKFKSEFAETRERVEKSKRKYRAANMQTEKYKYYNRKFNGCLTPSCIFLDDPKIEENFRTQLGKTSYKPSAPDLKAVTAKCVIDEAPELGQYGVFALEDIEPGSVISEYTGEDALADDYTPGLFNRYYTLILERDDGTLLKPDGFRVGNEAAMLNCSDKPNTEFRIRNGRAVIVSTKLIKAGEQLSVAYENAGNLIKLLHLQDRFTQGGLVNTMRERSGFYQKPAEASGSNDVDMKDAPTKKLAVGK